MYIPRNRPMIKTTKDNGILTISGYIPDVTTPVIVMGLTIHGWTLVHLDLSTENTFREARERTALLTGMFAKAEYITIHGYIEVQDDESA